MTVGLFVSFLLLASLFTPIGLWLIYRRSKLTGSFIVQEEYTPLPNGDLRADRATFHAQPRQMTLNTHQGLQTIPFGAITALIIEVGTSRKVHISLALADQDEPLYLSTVTNHDLKQAAQNGHLVVEMVAGRGNDFLDAFKQHEWSRLLIGNRFEYPLREP